MHLYVKGGHAFGLRRTESPITEWPRLVETGAPDAATCDGHANMAAESVAPLHMLLRDNRAPDSIPVDSTERDDEDLFSGIRCPLCGWRPTASSVWSCDCSGTPEPSFQACGTVWNTFSTHGRCPGCSHQWQWTSCLRCGEPSLHEAWYEERDGGL
jgi:hypothetical protein